MNQEQYQWMVHVSCVTFNHASYIVDAMNGFTMQQTTFPFVCTIVDDASTDDEPEVIRRYLRESFDLENHAVVRNEETDDYVLCFAQHKANKNCYFAVLWLKYNHYSIKKAKIPYIAEWHDNAKYFAACEGDDYWIDPLKLQKQFDILENDEGISFCHHNFYELRGNNKTLKKRNVPQRQDILSIANNNQTQTLTMFFRNIKPLIPEELNGRIVYSQFWALRLAEIGDIYYIDEPMAVYRRHEGGVFGKQKLSNKFVMIVTNLDNMIYWSNKNGRRSVVNILKKRGRKTAFSYFFAFIKRYDLKNAITALKVLYKYC